MVQALSSKPWQTMNTDPDTPAGKLWPAAGLLYILSLCLHLVFLLEVRDEVLFQHPVIDMLWHRLWASSILEGNFSQEVFFRAPLYPYFLALVFGIAGEGYFWPRVVQAVIGSTTCVLVFHLAWRMEQRFLVALFAGLISAFYPLLLYFNTEFLIPVLILPLDLALLISVVAMPRQCSLLRWALPGFLLGLSALARPTVLILVPAILLWMLFTREWRSLRAYSSRASVLLIALGLTIAPATVHNLIVGQDFVLISSQAGVNFWIGNNPEADGKSALAPGSQVRAGEYVDNVWLSSVMIARGRTNEELKASQVSRYWFRQGLNYWVNEPASAAGLFLKKCYFMINGTEIPSNRSIYFYAGHSKLWSFLVSRGPLKFPFGLLLPLAAAGMVLVDRRRYSLLYLTIAFYALGVVLFFVNARFRLPLIPLLIIFAAGGLSAFISLAKRGKWKSLIAPFIVFAVFSWFANTSWFGVADEDLSKPHLEIGNSYFIAGEYDKALSSFVRAYELNPRSVAILNALGAIHYLGRDFDKAEKFYLEALALPNLYPQIPNNLGLIYEQKGKLDAAENYFRRALGLDPTYIDAKMNLERIIMLRGINTKEEQ